MFSKVQLRLLLLWLFVTITNSSKAQEFYDKALSLETWYNGKVVLRNGEVEKGSINFNYVLDMVQIKSEDHINIYSKNQIQSFKIYTDSENDRERNYKSLNLPIGYRVYEVLAEDPEKAFLVSTQVDEKTYTYYTQLGNPTLGGPTMAPTSFSIERRSEDYYLIDKKGQIDYFGRILFRRNNNGQASSEIIKKDLLKKLKEIDPKINQYIKEEGLNIKKHSDLIQVIFYVMDKEQP